MKRYKNKGFTLVEVLICVGIIGIIAAITIPALLTSTSEKALETQRKALHSRMAQAFGQIKNLKLYEQTKEEIDEDTGDPTGEIVDNRSALNFIVEGLSKTYKLTRTCDKDSLTECGVPTTIYDYWSDTEEPYKYTLTSGTTFGDTTGLNEYITTTKLNDLNVDVAAFKTANGESVLLYYNPKCVSKSEANQDNFIRSVCVNMIYDLNGKNSPPNAYGEDIGYITVFYPTDSIVVMPVLYHSEDGIYTSSSFSAMLTNASAKELVPPTLEDLISILVNKNLTYITSTEANKIDGGDLFWSSSYTQDGTTNAWTAGLSSGIQKQTATGTGATSHKYLLIEK